MASDPSRRKSARPKRPASGTAVPVDQQSVVPGVRGVPWWGAVLIAAGFTAVGAIIDSLANSSLGLIYNVLFLLGCVLAALAVRRRSLFTAAVQPPLITLGIGLISLFILAQANNATGGSQGLRAAVLKVVLPFTNTFPWILTTFVLSLIVVGARWLLTRDAARAGSPRRSANGAGGSSTKAGASTSKAGSSNGKAGAPSPGTKAGSRLRSTNKGGASTREGNSATREGNSATREGDPARRAPRRPQTDRPQPDRGAAKRPQPAQARPPRPRTAQPRPEAPPSGTPPRRVVEPARAERSARRAEPQVIPPTPQAARPRRTAGQLRAEGAIEDLTLGLDD